MRNRISYSTSSHTSKICLLVQVPCRFPTTKACPQDHTPHLTRGLQLPCLYQLLALGYLHPISAIHYLYIKNLPIGQIPRRSGQDHIQLTTPTWTMISSRRPLSTIMFPLMDHNHQVTTLALEVSPITFKPTHCRQKGEHPSLLTTTEKQDYISYIAQSR